MVVLIVFLLLLASSAISLKVPIPVINDSPRPSTSAPPPPTFSLSIPSSFPIDSVEFPFDLDLPAPKAPEQIPQSFIELLSVDKCRLFDVGEYNIRLCAFQNLTQIRKDVPSGFILGIFDRWNSSDNSMLFDNGNKCSSGKKRSAKVNFRCAAKEEIADFHEISVGEYTMTFYCAEACFLSEQESDKEIVSKIFEDQVRMAENRVEKLRACIAFVQNLSIGLEQTLTNTTAATWKFCHREFQTFELDMNQLESQNESITTDTPVA